MKEFEVNIPHERFSELNFITEGLPGVAVVNVALRNFKSKEVFDWHLSVMIQLENVTENGMAAAAEMEIVDPFGDDLDMKIKGDAEQPNALFLARITWNGMREMVWRVYDPEVADKVLNEIIVKNESRREFEYNIEIDPEWKMTEWHLQEWD